MLIKIENIEYTGLFMDSPERLLKMFEPKHKKIYANHSTNQYKPTGIGNLEIGKKSMLKIIGRAHDQKGDALLVENAKSKNKYPHITVSCAENVPPVYSNELLDNASTNNSLEIFENPFFIEATEGYADYDGKIILSENQL